MDFPTKYDEILQRIESIDPLKYGETRNHLNGAVTYLSPYISRGVISTKLVLESVLLKGYKLEEMESFVKELCWRDYFQRLGQERDLKEDIKSPQLLVSNHEISSNVVLGQTGIDGIDTGIHQLYQTGYMHNHVRMYVASLVCNIAQSHWKLPSKWLYYHLLDGDWASNVCSWQWVSGANSSKKYYANQSNINTFTRTQQTGTFLDRSYEDLPQIQIPNVLQETENLSLKTNLPEKTDLNINTELPTFIYTYYQLDPLWHAGVKGNRILLLDPMFFREFPVSDRCISFMMELTKNIPELQIYVGSFESLSSEYGLGKMYFKEHPLTKDFIGTEEPRDWICKETTGYFPSFFAYWKRVRKQLMLKTAEYDH